MSTSHDYRRVAAICRELEREHGLTNAAARSGRGSGRVRADTEATRRGDSQPDRDWLRLTIGRVLGEGGGIDELRAAGVAVKLNQASTRRISGISYARAPEPGRDGGEAEPIWFTGSQLGKAYGWNQIGGRLRDATPARGEQTPPGPTPAAARQRGEVGGELAEPLDQSLELTPPSVAERRAQALAGARERAADRARHQQRDREQDRDR